MWKQSWIAAASRREDPERRVAGEVGAVGAVGALAAGGGAGRFHCPRAGGGRRPAGRWRGRGPQRGVGQPWRVAAGPLAAGSNVAGAAVTGLRHSAGGLALGSRRDFLCHPGGPGPERTWPTRCGRAWWRCDAYSANVVACQRSFVRRLPGPLHYHPGPRRAGRRQRRVAGRGRATRCGPSAGVPAVRAAGPPVHAAAHWLAGLHGQSAVGRLRGADGGRRLPQRAAADEPAATGTAGGGGGGHGDDVLVAGDDGQRAQPDGPVRGTGYICTARISHSDKKT